MEKIAFALEGAETAWFYVLEQTTIGGRHYILVTEEEEGVYELKNLAVDPAYQRKGIGRQMVDFLCRHYQQMGHTMLVGTGDSRQTISFYQSCGFTYSHTLRGFFTENYDHPIIEDGKVLTDMIYFRKEFNF